VLALGQQAARRATGVDTLLLPAWSFALCGHPAFIERAVTQLERVVALDPTNREAHWWLTVASAWSGQSDKAIEVGERYLRMFEEDPEVTAWVASAHHQKGDVRTAIRVGEHALELYGDGVPHYVLLRMSDLYEEVGDRSRAKGMRERALRLCLRQRELAPGNLRVRASLWEAYLRLGLKKEFAAEFDSLARLDGPPLDPGDWTHLAYQDPQLRPRVVDFVARSYPRWHATWYSGLPILSVRVPLDYRKDPRLARQAAAARAYEDSLLQRYGLPPQSVASL
jgi:tetratricopeptide (TPR) repeat protein